MKIRIFSLLLGLTFIMVACNKPKVVEAEINKEMKASSAQPKLADGTHKVVVKEVMHTSKYTYLEVEESGDKYWIAVPGTDVSKGSTYYYSGGLMKKNFHSKEFDRTFETIYLVSGISKHPQGSGGSAIDEAYKKVATKENTPTQKLDPDKYKGGVPIADIYANPSKYEGQVITVKGKVIKVNNQIMNRNWLHLLDGTTDGSIDLTVTTQENITEGSEVTLEGKIALNKDFGAGYKYQVIMEDAKVK